MARTRTGTGVIAFTEGEGGAPVAHMGKGVVLATIPPGGVTPLKAALHAFERRFSPSRHVSAPERVGHVPPVARTSVDPRAHLPIRRRASSAYLLVGLARNGLSGGWVKRVHGRRDRGGIVPAGCDFSDLAPFVGVGGPSARRLPRGARMAGAQAIRRRPAGGRARV